MCVRVDEKEIEKDKEIDSEKEKKTYASIKMGGHKDGVRVRDNNLH